MTAETLEKAQELKRDIEHLQNIKNYLEADDCSIGLTVQNDRSGQTFAHLTFKVGRETLEQVDGMVRKSINDRLQAAIAEFNNL